MFARHVLRALACIFLLSSLALAGCETLEKIDQKSDDLLDEINDPGSARLSSSSHSSGSSSKDQNKGSGLSVVRRLAMPRNTVEDRHGNTVVIWGQSQSSSKTPGHAATIEAKAYSMAKTGDYEYITMQRCWRTATNRSSNCRLIPDVIGVRHDGRVDAFEVKSDSDKEPDLMRRLEEGMETLPEQHRGDYNVIPADPSMKGGLFAQ